MNILTILSTIFSYWNKQSSNVRLEKQVPKSKFDTICERACPYVLLSFILILLIITLIILVRYGYCFSTEANTWQRMVGII